MLVYTTPDNPQSESTYYALWLKWSKETTHTFPFDLFKMITMGSLSVANFIIHYCNNSRRHNFIFYLYKQGYAGDALHHLIFDVCGGENSEVDKLMLKMEQRIVNTNDLNHLTQERRKIRYL